ncbi:UDP binding domain-containing protein, partial [Actinomadura adrarensis]
ATIRGQGGKVTVYDPQAMNNARRAHPTLDFGESTEDAVRDAHVVLLLTEWQEFKDLDPHALAELVAERNIVDGRNALDPEKWRNAGWTYRALGRP